MLLRQIRYFCSVVRTGSFTKAAEECYISQSAISQQVKALETEIGVELLVRHGRSFDVTPAGRVIARRGEKLLADADEMVAEAIDISSGKPRRISIGYLNRYEGWEVAGAVAAFARRHPGCEVITEAGSHDQLYEGLVSGRLDVAFNDRRRSLSDAYVNRHLMTCYRYAEVSEASTVAWAEHVSCQELESLPCVLVSTPAQQDVERSWWRDVMNFHGEFLFAASVDEGRMMVAGNRGWMPIESRDQSGRSGTVVRRIPLFDASGHSTSEYYAFWPKDRTGQLIEEFADVLEGLFGK